MSACVFLTVLCDCVDPWLGGDSSEGLEDPEDMLCNTVLITGPTGVGKTAAVYACAQELGFKVSSPVLFKGDGIKIRQRYRNLVMV